MIKLIKNKKTKTQCNAYSLVCSNKNITKIGNYDQMNNTLRLNLDKYLVVLSKGDKPSKKVAQLLKKAAPFSKTKKIKLRFK